MWIRDLGGRIGYTVKPVYKLRDHLSDKEKNGLIRQMTS